jgi:hypothetical protein
LRHRRGYARRRGAASEPLSGAPSEKQPAI